MKTGILNKATQAKVDTIVGKEKEAILLAWNSLILDKNTGKISDIDEDSFEQELNKNENITQVDYVDNDVTKDFSVTFKDTTHEYIVDRNGNIRLIGNNSNLENDDNIEFIGAEEYIIENYTLNSNFSFNGKYCDSGKPYIVSNAFYWGKPAAYCIAASWRGTKAIGYIEQEIDFDRVERIEVEIYAGSNCERIN